MMDELVSLDHERDEGEVGESSRKSHDATVPYGRDPNAHTRTRMRRIRILCVRLSIPFACELVLIAIVIMGGQVHCSRHYLHRCHVTRIPSLCIIRSYDDMINWLTASCPALSPKPRLSTFLMDTYTLVSRPGRLGLISGPEVSCTIYCTHFQS